MRRTKELSAILLSIILVIGIFPLMQVNAAAVDTEGTSTAASGDNSLSSLSLSAGSLSPAFQYNVTDYTASVGQDVSSVEVSAKTSNAAAVIESISGNTELQPGQNTISIVVKAENGMTATYKIIVTREGNAESVPEQGAEQPDTGTQSPETGAEHPEGGTEAQEGNQGGITVNGHPFNLAPAIPDDIIPEDFTKATVNCQGQQVEGLQYGKGTLTLVYLTTPSTEVKNTLAVYEEASGVFYPFRKISQGENQYLILLNPPAETGLSQEYSLSDQKVSTFENVPVFVKAGAGAAAGDGAGGFQGAEGTEESSAGAGYEFVLVYGTSSFGNTGWYQYDAVEGTFQRYQSEGGSVQGEGSEDQEEEPSVEMQGLQNAYKDLEVQYNKKKDSSRKTTAVLIFVIAVLVIVVINLLLRGRKDDDGLEEKDYEEPEQPMRKRLQPRNERETEAQNLPGRKHLGAEDRERVKVSRRSRHQEEFKEERPLKRKRHEDELKEEKSRRNYREEEPKEGAKGRRNYRGDELEVTKSHRKIHREDEYRTKPEPKPKTKFEDIDDDFEVIDLEDL